MRARGADVSLRDVTLAWDGKRGYRVRMTSRTGSARRILGIWRKLQELRLDTGQEGLTFACSRRPWAGAAPDGWGCRWKSQNGKIVPLSPYVEKPLDSKVIKVSYLNREVVSVFRVSRFLCSVLYINEHYMSISHMAESGYGTAILGSS